MKKYGFHITEYSYGVILELINQYKPRYRKNYFVKYLYIMDYIMRGSERHLNCVPVNRNMLSEILGSPKTVTSKILKELVDNSCLEIVKLHKVGTNSTCYRIPEVQSIAYSVKFLTDSKIVNKVIDKKNKQDCKFIDTEIGQLYLQYISNINISINLSSTESIVFLPIGVKLEISKFKKHHSNLKRIQEGDMFVKRRDRLSRVYCNLSMLHNAFRKYLRYDGKSLMALDITNSQPLLAGVLIKSLLSNPTKEVTEEIERYIKTCTDGVFYEQFMDDVEMTLEGDDRRDFKGKFFEQVFFSRVTKRKTKLKKKFITLYPNIYDIICEMKGGLDPENKNLYKKFAKKLQRFEASVIFDAVNAKMLEEGKGCFNIYDSIVSHDMDIIEEAKERIEKEFMKYGVKPSFKIEYYD